MASSKKRRLKRLPRKRYAELKPYLNSLCQQIDSEAYIKDDPVQFMHAYSNRLDQEMAGFFGALMAWGRRDIVINKVNDLLGRMDGKPAEFIGNYTDDDAGRFEGFKHRTFKPVDIHWLVTILSRILNRYGSFEAFWRYCYSLSEQDPQRLMSIFPAEFFALAPESADRTRKHVASAARNSSCKRIWLFLKWAVRTGSVVDLGMYDFMTPSELMIPLDVHVSRNARYLGLLTRHYNDWKAAVELTDNLRRLEPDDPAKYDFALFGMGIYPTAVPEPFAMNPWIISD